MCTHTTRRHHGRIGLLVTRIAQVECGWARLNKNRIERFCTLETSSRMKRLQHRQHKRG